MKKITHQLNHPDAYFYDLSASRESVSGMFQGDDIMPFEVSRLDYLEAAQRCGYIGDYEERPGGRVYVFQDYDGYDTDEAAWIEWTCDDGRAANEILKEVFRLRLERDLARIDEALNVPEVNGKRIDAAQDEQFCAAILELADIIRANNPDWVECREKTAAV